MNGSIAGRYSRPATSIPDSGANHDNAHRFEQPAPYREVFHGQRPGQHAPGSNGSPGAVWANRLRWKRDYRVCPSAVGAAIACEYRPADLPRRSGSDRIAGCSRQFAFRAWATVTCDCTGPGGTTGRCRQARVAFRADRRCPAAGVGPALLAADVERMAGRGHPDPR